MPSCRVWQEPVAKFEPGQLVKCVMKERTYYNYVVGSYYSREVGQRLYRLNERIAMPVYREDWLEAVSNEEIECVNASGRLRPAKMGGWDYICEQKEVPTV